MAMIDLDVGIYKLIKVTVHELEVTVTFENVIKGNYSIEYPGPFLNNNQFLIRNQSHDVGNFITLLTRLYTVSSYWITISLFGMKIKLFFVMNVHQICTYLSIVEEFVLYFIPRIVGFDS